MAAHLHSAPDESTHLRHALHFHLLGLTSPLVESRGSFTLEKEMRQGHYSEIGGKKCQAWVD